MSFMRLLSRTPDGQLRLKSFDTDDTGNTPPYAILSHTWTTDQEVTYQELVGDSGHDKTGYDKIRFCIDRAAADGIAYVWVDTCCIDKSSNTELSSAINSMFRWYQHAAKCYVYLSDVSVPDEVDDLSKYPVTWKEAFRSSRWFKRGWTLQELLAPPSVEFFSKEGRRLGSKVSLEQEVHQITKIPIRALRQQDDLGAFSVAERMKWTEGRSTAMKEDLTYCLLGIFGVFLPFIYGEGQDYARKRLEREVAWQQQGLATNSRHNTRDASLLPFPRNTHFVGREEQLHTLEQALFALYGHQRIALYGLGGRGKSAIAVELGYRAMIAEPNHLVFWVPAISLQTFEAAYREIGVRLRIPGISDDNADVKKLVQDALGSHDGQRWLMIVDNADDITVVLPSVGGGAGLDWDAGAHPLIDYLPFSERGKILFTTRSRKVATGLRCSGGIVELQDMDKPEAKQLFMQRVTTQTALQDDQAVEELLAMLTYLPLAIVQAAAFIDQNQLPVSDYVSMLQETGTDAELFGEPFDDPIRYRDLDSTIAKTWHISFQQIRQQDQLAAEYLSFIACINRTDIPQSILPPSGTRVQQIKAVGTLKAYAFITAREDVTSATSQDPLIDMHRLVHMALVWWLDGQGELTSWTRKTDAHLQTLIPFEGREGRETWTRYLPHAIRVAAAEHALDPLERARLLERIGRCQDELGRYSEAVDTLRQVLAVYSAVLGAENSDTIECMNSLAGALENNAMYEEAEAVSRQALALCKTVLGAKDPVTLFSMNTLALVLESQNKYEEAEAMHRQALALRETILGVGHPLTLSSMNNLATVLSRQDKFEEAEAMQRQTLALSKIVRGAEHPDTLTYMSNLAFSLGKQGEYEEAEAIHRQTLAQCEIVLGAEHPDTLTSVHNLAYLLANLQRYDESRQLYKRAIPGLTSVLGVNHPATRECLDDYSRLSSLPA